ncbi:hypothetical protein HOK51_01005 [Candidatus Woesearchaeota archaeon]|jgi:hypothetical protein|nr:hypothetical protein [Candidatus Woesearchaeota archaeon]MBT6518394.1 hypothetical protein [Candidatus Woesearchaeota archaeon]MBT7366826.1 hypothetical protein [Candidatus Woesearchaeota archaeon]
MNKKIKISLITAGLIAIGFSGMNCSTAKRYESVTGKKVEQPQDIYDMGIWAAKQGYCGRSVKAFEQSINRAKELGSDKLSLAEKYEASVELADCMLRRAKKIHFDNSVVRGYDKYQLEEVCGQAHTFIISAYSYGDKNQEDIFQLNKKLDCYCSKIEREITFCL